MILDILITLLLVALNGFFVAAEFAIVKVRASQLEIRVMEGNKMAALTKKIVSHLDGYLAATQLGITLASLGLGWIGEPVVSKLIIAVMHLFGMDISEESAHQVALPIAFAIITILHIVFGELAPKTMAIQRSEQTALFVSYPLQGFYLIFRPFIWMLNGISNVMLSMFGIRAVHGAEVHSSEELQYLVEQGAESGTIETENYDIIRNAFNFSESTVKQIMTHHTRVFAINLRDFNDTILDKLIIEGYSRIPCYDESSDHITGVIYMRDMLMKIRKGEPIDVRELVHAVDVVPESKRIGELLKEFQLKHQQMAIVVDELGVSTGIITMEDITEELVGEIQDESDVETPIVERTGKKTFAVLATATVTSINRILPHPVSKERNYETLAGTIITKFGRIPELNEEIEFDGYKFTILVKLRNSIIKVGMKDVMQT